MREILFRGIKNDGSGWCEGSLLCMNDGYYIYPHTYGDLGDIDFGYSFEEVIPETVVEFTGLLDKNGNKIFEGDIVQSIRKYKHLYERGDIMSVEFTTWSASYYLSITGGQLTRTKAESLLVIGNIHENPELL